MLTVPSQASAGEVTGRLAETPEPMLREEEIEAVWEEAEFRYLLGVEAARARRAGRPFLVLTADLLGRDAAGRVTGGEPGGDVPGDLPGPDLLPALAGCLREADLVGWHRAGRVAAVVLAGTPAEAGPAHAAAARVLAGLGAALPPALARRLRVRVHRLGLPGAGAGPRRLVTLEGGDEAPAGRVAARPAGARREPVPAPAVAAAVRPAAALPLATEPPPLPSPLAAGAASRRPAASGAWRA